ncbi:Transcription factor IIIA [Bagarius yarrelli]|uniref:Transcription factor IIIA n=1 Tax=Bagarius yarrelli TaxID=175774 RepID=A0A556TWI8_BAGYA|nr:Transcription factor IIIA [Bagarius yarrelli]
MGERLKNPANYFVCSFSNCKASFSKSWKLEAHYCKHTGLRPFACDSCDKSFCTRYQLTRHNLSHSGEKPYQCSYEGCGKMYASFNKLKKHENVHNGYPCAEDGCTFQGKTWSEYQAHRKVEHRVALPCDSCEKVFHNLWVLKKHKLFVHTGVRRIFECTKEGCTKTYTRQFNLQNHILSFHEGKRDFICPRDGCGKAFAMEESLKRHSVVHDPQKKKMQKTTKKGKKPKATVSKPHKISAQLQNLSLNKP